MEMVKYSGDEREEYRLFPLSESSGRGWEPGQGLGGKVRPGA